MGSVSPWFQATPWNMRKSAFVAAAVLLLMFGLALMSMVQKSPTFDEQGFITRGVGYLRGQNRHMRVGHPLGLNALNGSLVAFDERVALPVDDLSWAETSFHRPSELFLWEIGNDVARVMFLARLPTVWLGLLLAAVTGRWAWEMTRNRYAGLLALALIALDPNVLAHTRLATTDLGLAAGAALAGFSLWRFMKQPAWAAALIAGAAFGLLQNTKFTALLFGPLFALVILANSGFASRWNRGYALPNRQSPGTDGKSDNRQSLLTLLIGYSLAALLTLWAGYGFQISALPDNLPALPQMAGRSLPLAHHLEQLLDIGGRLRVGTPAFLLGRYSDSGWWTYFPVAFLLKTPLPTLILLGWAGWRAGRLASGERQDAPMKRRPAASLFDLSALLVPALGYFAIALTTDVNLGYRHLLPILPFLYVFIAAVLIPPLSFHVSPSKISHKLRRLGGSRLMLAGLIIWLALGTLLIYPHFLAFFNVLAGGPDNGWRALVDSNIDWGQDLGALKVWMDENGVDHVWLSYFGEARPAYYGIDYTGLDSWPPRLMNAQARPFYPDEPAPGVYAISATNLQGVLFQNHDQFAWFRQREPIDKIGYSIFIYEVEPYGQPVELALGGLQLDDLAAADYARLGTNDVTPHWFDPGQSLLMPAGENRWLALRRAAAVPANWAPLLDRWTTEVVTDGYTFYRLPPEDAATPAAEGRLNNGTGEASLLSAQWLPELLVPADDVTLETDWRQEAPPQPIKMFIHLTDAEGQIVSQWDGLGVAWEGWRTGDRLRHLHHLAIPEATRPGTYEFWAGLYHPESGRRWQTAGGDDRIYLGEIEVADGE